MKSVLFLFIMMSALGGWASAGESGAHGGKGVYCDQPDGTRKLMLLDYVRAESEWHFRMSYAPGLNEVEKALNLVSRIKKIDPVRYATYSAKIPNFTTSIIPGDKKDDVLWVDHFSDDVKTEDSNELGSCKNPKTVQVVIQYPFDKKREAWEPKQDFVIDKSRWNELDADQKAGLIIHELILNEEIGSLQSTDAVMGFNSEIAANLFENMSQPDYNKFLQNSGFAVIDSFSSIEVHIADRIAAKLSISDLHQIPDESAILWFGTDVPLEKSSKYISPGVRTLDFILPKEMLGDFTETDSRGGSLFKSSHQARFEIKGFGKIPSCFANSYDPKAFQKMTGDLKPNQGIHFVIYVDYIADNVDYRLFPGSACLWNYFAVQIIE